MHAKIHSRMEANMNIFKYEILSAIPQWEIERHFKKICVSNGQKHEYIGKGWSVTLIFLEPKIHHSIKLPQTRIEFSGDKAPCEVVIDEYRKAFMRGGA